MSRPCFLCCVAGAILAVSTSGMAAEVREIRYAGALSQPAPAGDLVLRQFEVLVLNSDDTTFFSVLDDERDGCPWPESFGQLNAADAPRPHLQYDYDGALYSLPLPPVVLDLPDDAAAGSRWMSDSWTFQLVEKVTIEGVSAWNVEASERRGRRLSLSVAADSGILLKGNQDVFMGQGQQFVLTIQQTSSTIVPDDVAEQVGQLQSGLLALQSTLHRRPDSQLAELSPRQIELAAGQFEALSALAKNTPLQESVLRMRRDVDRQQQRVARSMKRQQQLLNSPAPSFSLNLVTSGTLESGSLKGRTIVLHFWQYAEKPLAEPYGQVGYLEFLHNKLQKNGVHVIGVATNPALQQPTSLSSGRRTARKLIEFMNLSYPVGYDDGSLLRAFGDPRDSGGELPLWVVVSPSGQVIHYHGGFYEIDQRQGLKELDDLLSGQQAADSR
ncbi:MAG: TlpA disulfide reductase family protein [Fuerstiella sp.]